VLIVGNPLVQDNELRLFAIQDASDSLQTDGTVVTGIHFGMNYNSAMKRIIII